MTPTHWLKLADGYGQKACEVLRTEGPLFIVQCLTGAYWEPDRLDTRVVRTDNLARMEG